MTNFFLRFVTQKQVSRRQLLKKDHFDTDSDSAIESGEDSYIDV